LISCGKLESITNFHSPTQKVKEAVKINSILEGCLLQRLNYKHKVRRQATNFDEKVGCCYLLVSDGGRVEQTGEAQSGRRHPNHYDGDARAQLGHPRLQRPHNRQVPANTKQAPRPLLLLRSARMFTAHTMSEAGAMGLYRGSLKASGFALCT